MKMKKFSFGLELNRVETRGAIPILYISSSFQSVTE